MTPLVSPYGGSLVDLMVPQDERPGLLDRAARLPSITLSERGTNDLELLATGGFSPLRSFLGREDTDRVLADWRRWAGTLWPIPVRCRPAGPPPGAGLDRDVALRSQGNELLAVLTVEEAFERAPEEEVRAVVGRLDPRHPLAAEAVGWGPVCLSGRLRVLSLPRHVEFDDLRLPPALVRQRLASMGSANVVAFQTRNPLHRCHEELLRRAVASCGASLLLHPVVGLTKPGDVDAHTRVRSYRALVERRFDRARTLLALLPLAMRMAGPREAVWHAIVRRNHGASHFVVGRDHAGPGADSSGRPFFGPYDAQEALARHSPEVGVTLVPFREMVYLPAEDRYEEEDRVSAGVEKLTLSGSQVRDEYLARGRLLPEWFTRPEVARILRESTPPRNEVGFCVWFTGLSGSGKSTTAEVLADLLLSRGRRVTLLDGDVVRTHLSKGLGFSREDRDANIRRIGFVAAEVVKHRGVAVCAAVSPYLATREECRRMVGADQFLEVFVDTPVEVCEARDVKGLYARARQGLLRGFTGVDDPYEPPASPEVTLATTDSSAEANARKVLAVLEERGFVRL